MDLVASINKIIYESGRDLSRIKTIPTKTYTNISFYGLSYIRIKNGPKSKYISIPTHLDYMLSLYNITATKSIGWHRICIDNVNDVSKLSELVLEIFDYCYAKSVGDTFGCCSSYVECSDAKACIKEHERWSKGCIYRVNLINGKIFYGKNAMP